MTAFSTPLSQNARRRASRTVTPAFDAWLRAAIGVCCLFACLVSLARADGVQVKSAQLLPSEDWYYLYTDFDMVFPKALEEALNKGVSLNFMVEFELTKPRWYWFDENVATVRQNLRLSYHALTRQYHFSGNQGNRAFPSLSDAKDELRHIAEWKVVDRSQLKKGVNYQAAVRIRLDVNQLPKPLQIEALSSKDWNFNSDWYRFPVTP
jgi:hypothetical protein